MAEKKIEAPKAEKKIEAPKAEKKIEAAQEKMVKIRIPRTSAKQEDVPVWVNERSWMIKRCVEVEVPECVAEVLKHQEDMLEKIMLFEEQNKR